MQAVRQPEVITQTPVALSSAAPAASPAPEVAASFGEVLNQSVAQAETRRMVRKGESSVPGMDKVVTPQTDFSFWDFLDMINPLQHIPIVSDYYRQATGDTIKPELKIAGGIATGGVFGLFASVAGVIMDGESSPVLTAAAPEMKKHAAVQAPPAPQQLARATIPTMAIPANSKADTDKNDVLDVFGNPNASAHASYAQANMLGYLRDVSVSEKL